MAIDFPDNPTLNQQFTVGDRTWTWDGTRWEAVQAASRDAYQVAIDNGFIGSEEQWLDSLAGVIQSTTAPQNTNAIWIDTDEPGNAVLPLAGTTGQILAKVSNSDYDTEWIDAPDPDLSGLIPKSTVTTAGDLIVADGNASVTRLGIGANGAIPRVASGALGYLPVGSNGQVLTVSSGVPQWVTPSGASLVWTQIFDGALPTGASTSSVSGLGGYDKYAIWVQGLSTTAQADVKLGLNANVNGKSAGIGYVNSTTGTIFGSGTSNQDRIGTLPATAGISGFASIWGAAGTGAAFMEWRGGSTGTSANDLTFAFGQMATKGSAALTSIRFETSAGTFDAGSCTIWGAN